MNNDNNKNTEQVSNNVNDGLNQAGNTASKGLKTQGKKLVKKGAKIGKKLGKAGLKSVKKAGLVGGVSFLGGFMIILGVVLLLYVLVPSTKSYSSQYVNNSNDSTLSVVNTSSGVSTYRARSGISEMVGSITNQVVKKETNIKLSEENQAIENYHYYNSMKSLYDNKYYTPLKEVDLSKVEGETTIDKLLNIGVLKIDNEKNQLIYNEKYLGELEKITDESKKVEVADEYEREPYFQLPEELLGMLNTMVFKEDVVYDKPFLKGVPVKYSKTEEMDLGRPVYEFRTDSLGAKTKNISKTNGLGSVFIYKPSFEVSKGNQGSQVNQGSETGSTQDLVYMGDSLFVGIQNSAGVPKENVVATVGHNLVNGLKVSLPEVVKKKPKMVVMDYGSNDAADGVSKYKERYIKLITELKKELPGVKVYMTKLYNSMANKLNSAIDEVAKETGATVIDSSSVFKSEYVEPDKVHYTAEGYKVWKNDIESKIFGNGGSAENTPVSVDSTETTFNPKYLLDRVVTFAGVYKFEYEVETEVVDGKIVSQKEVPKDVVRETVDKTYIYSYLSNLTVEVPKNLLKKFDIRYIVQAFKGVKGSMSSGGGSEVDGGGSEGSALENVEKWREIVEKVSERWGIDPGLLLALMHNESGGDPHTKTGSFEGLFCFGPYDDEVAYYVKGDPVYGNYTSKNRRPSCPTKGPHNEAEHLKIGEFNIELMARRFSATMGLYLKRVKGIDYENVDVSPQDLQEAILFACAAHQTGEYGQLVAVDHYGPSTLYGNKGNTYYDLFKKHIDKGGEWMYSKTPAVKKILAKWRFQGLDNRVYMQRTYKHYPLYNNGLELDKITEDPEKLALFDPKKWMKHKAAGGSSGEGGSATSQVTTGTNGMSIDSAKVTEYMKFEEGLIGKGKWKGKGTIVRNLSRAEVDLILEQSIGMMNGEVYLTSKQSKLVFWKDGYESVYFAQGEAVKPPPGYNMEQGIWKNKIKDGHYTGDKTAIRELAKNYGEGMFTVINRLLNQDGLPYKEGGSMIDGFDMAGLIWYGFNYGEKNSLFEKGKIEEYAENFKNVVEEGDIRPGDVSFFSKPGDKEEKIVDAIIYLGNDAGIYVDSEIGQVTIVEYSEFITEAEKRILKETKRILKFTKGLAGEFNENKAALSGMPAGFVEGDYAFPILFKNVGDIRLTDGVGVRQIHPASKKPNIPHFGVDYAGPVGTPIIATKKGIVLRAGNSGNSAGYIVVLDHQDGTTSAYYHLQPGTIKVSAGQPVEQGQELAGLGNSGIGTGAHLQFEIAIGLPNHTHGASRDMSKFVPVQNMFKDLGIADTRKVPHNTIYPGNPAHWNNRNS